jgi:hypothetical protein
LFYKEISLRSAFEKTFSSPVHVGQEISAVQVRGKEQSFEWAEFFFETKTMGWTRI